ncbi:hypothetical protein Xcel_0587 [Xylanimonas cellulosilytica DSM 15894]|uniref:Uncharacterized protein n=1 Tax=Xylanimonas cellulosilytica (strain DSM 15894 / JCM 12276 / CECT 5975 / KCTC 9989 / LMG 20990 / NBRC 107835 / XIL07) TaxID=446471 RepID=D1BWP4_XYLCX|nr:hypothetical protein [Xylanimonas cellulosilytica]ACZ29626.1 hypothetical protein Xcel_0587 [Xylanimonas cellulosilytica DSM 15894]
MGAPTITVEVDGQSYDTTDVTWISYAPCGCVEGASTVDGRSYGGELILAEAQVLAKFYDTKAERDKAKAQGFRFEIRPRDEVKTLMGDCPHTPKWGIEPRPTLEGHAWGIKDSGRVAHLVPTYGKERGSFLLHGDKFSERYDLGHVESLCGSVRDMNWRVAGSSVPECTRCTKRAVA